VILSPLVFLGLTIPGKLSCPNKKRKKVQSKAVFKLAKFATRIPVKMPLIAALVKPTLATLGGTAQIGSFLFLPHLQRYQGQIPNCSCLLVVSVASTNKIINTNKK
jgi:hypothetical protein